MNEETNVSFKETKILSFGEILIGTDFSIESENKAIKVKNLMAELTNIVLEEYNDGDKSPVKSLLFDHAVGEIVSAQMAIVKVITFKN